MTEPVRTYQLTLSERSMKLTANALDFWDRTLGGQFNDLERALLDRCPDGKDELVSDLIRHMLEQVRGIVFPQLGPGGGDFTFPGGFLAFNLRKTIEHAVCWTDRPLAKGEWGGVWYDGPMDGWWEGEPPAIALRWEGSEAVRIRDAANQTRTLGARLEKALGTSDIDEAERKVLAWKAAYDRQEGALNEPQDASPRKP